MSDRVHLLIDESDKARYQEIAAREGKSLSVWLREAAEERYRATAGERTLRSREELDAFFAQCDARETGAEPDWDVHRRVIEESITGVPSLVHESDSRKRGR